MATESRMFNGSTFTFDGTRRGKADRHFLQGRAATGSRSPSRKTSISSTRSGQADLQVQLSFKGGAAGNLSYGDKGTAAITWKDGSTTPCPGTWMVGPEGCRGKLGQSDLQHPRIAAHRARFGVKYAVGSRQ